MIALVAALNKNWLKTEAEGMPINIYSASRTTIAVSAFLNNTVGARKPGKVSNKDDQQLIGFRF